MPSLSYTGKVTLIGAVGLSVGGLLGGIGTASAAGSMLLTTLCLAWVACVPLPRRMRRERLEFTWWTPTRVGGARRPDEPVTLRIALRNPTSETLIFGTPRLAMSPGLRHSRWKGHRIVVPPTSVATFDLEVRPSHTGRHILHGAWLTLSGPLGLSWAPLYFPNPLTLEVQPRAFGPASMPAVRARTSPALRAGRSTRRVGEGPELKELRDHQPSDPYRRIAWKASARRGKLVVRETEDEAQTTRVMLIDASATMRGDSRGGARIDYAIELLAQSARISVSTGDRLGMVGFDARVVSQVAPDDGPMHARALVTAAIELRAIVDEDLTDIDDDALVDTVARYFREQEGLDLRRDAHPVEARRNLAKLIERVTLTDPVMRLPVRASDSIGRTLRAFCRARAIPLPLKHDPTGRRRALGLSAAINAAVAGAREPRTVLVVSDMETLGDLGELKHSIGAARVKHHRITVIAPAGEDFTGRSTVDPRDAAVRRAVCGVFLAEEALRLRELRTRLAVMGVGMYSARLCDPAAKWLRHAAVIKPR